MVQRESQRTQLDLFEKSEIVLEKNPQSLEIVHPIRVITARPQDIADIEMARCDLPIEQNSHELPAYTEFKQYLTSENPFLNCQSDDEVNDIWNEEWRKIIEQTDILKNQKSELTEQLKQYRGRGKETAKLRTPINTQIAEIDAQLKVLKEKESDLQLYQTAVSLRIVQKIVDNIFSFEPEFNLVRTLEDCWEIDDYENYLLSVTKLRKKAP